MATAGATPSWTDCAYSIARGTLIGSLIGGGFHVVGGGLVRAQGRTTLQTKHIADQAVKGALRLGGALALYTSIRCPLLHATGSDALSCGAAGGVTVMTLTATDPGRIAFLKQYFQAVLGSAVSSSSGGKGAAVRPVPTHLVLASAAMSGAIVFGGSDMLAHRLLGLRW